MKANFFSHNFFCCIKPRNRFRKKDRSALFFGIGTGFGFAQPLTILLILKKNTMHHIDRTTDENEFLTTNEEEFNSEYQNEYEDEYANEEEDEFQGEYEDEYANEEEDEFQGEYEDEFTNESEMGYESEDEMMET